MFYRKGTINKLEEIKSFKNFYCPNCGKKIGKRNKSLIIIDATGDTINLDSECCPFCNEKFNLKD